MNTVESLESQTPSTDAADVGIGLETGEAQRTPVDVADQSEPSQKSSSPKVVDKRRKIKMEARVDPASEFLDKVFNYIINQPEFYTIILPMSRPARKELGQQLGKLITRFPRFTKVGPRGQD